MPKTSDFAYLSEPQTLGQSISITLTSLCKFLIFVNYYFSPFDHWVVDGQSWHPVLESLPEKLDLSPWIQIPCFMVLVLGPSIIFSVATLVKNPRRVSGWSGYLLQAGVMIPISLALVAVVAVMKRCGIPDTTEDVSVKTQHDDHSSPSSENPTALLTTLMIRTILAGLTNAALQRLSCSSPASAQWHPLLHQATLLSILGFCKSDYAHRCLIGLVQIFGLPALPPPSLTLKTLLSSCTIYGIEGKKSFITPVRWALSYVLVHLYPQLFSESVISISGYNDFNVALEDLREAYPSLEPKRRYRSIGAHALLGIICVVELAIRVIFGVISPWLWTPLQHLKDTGVWLQDAAANTKLVMDVATAMLRAVCAGDWDAAKGVASIAYEDHTDGVFFVGFYIVVFAWVIFVALCAQWFNAYLARRSAQL